MSDLRMAETVHGTYFYHLVEVTTDDLKQGKLTAICGVDFDGWEVVFPVDHWMQPDHLGSRYCPRCEEARKSRRPTEESQEGSK